MKCTALNRKTIFIMRQKSISNESVIVKIGVSWSQCFVDFVIKRSPPTNHNLCLHNTKDKHWSCNYQKEKGEYIKKSIYFCISCVYLNRI